MTNLQTRQRLAYRAEGMRLAPLPGDIAHRQVIVGMIRKLRLVAQDCVS